MFQNVKIFLIFFLAAILQISFLPNLFFNNSAPDLVLIIIIIWSFKLNFNNLWIWIVVISFVLDIMNLERVGTNGIIFLVISVMVDFLANRFFVTQRNRVFFVLGIFVIGGTLINYISLNFIVNLSNHFFNQANYSFLKIFKMSDLIFKIINNLMVFILIYWPITQFKIIFPVKENKLIVR